MKSWKVHVFSDRNGIDKDDYRIRLARLRISPSVTKGHPFAICGDSLALENGSGSLKLHLPAKGFDVLLTNPPFGVRYCRGPARDLEDI